MSTENPTPKPTIEKRLEAVVQTLELIAAMQRDHEKLLADHEKLLAASDQRWNQRTIEWDARFDKLLTIVESHDRRIQHLEGDQP
jgi:hypothetical protein